MSVFAILQPKETSIKYALKSPLKNLTFAEMKILTFWLVFLAMGIILPIHIFIPVALGLYLGLLWMGWVNPIDDKKDT
jgi:hypothetical protein